MPELPDVETMRNYFHSTAMRKTVLNVNVFRSEVLEDVSPEDYRKRIQNRKFVDTRRHGKHLFVKLDNDSWLTFHFGMTAFFKYYKDDADLPSHARLVHHLDNGYHLAYDCRRLLGRVGLCEDVDEYIAEKDLGPDALAPGFSADRFLQALNGRKGMIKPTLMNQRILAGVGSEYADEILYQARIHPKKTVDHLSQEDLRLIYEKMRTVLETAVDRRADVSELPKSYLVSHRQEGGECPNCNGKIKKIKVSGRGSYYCPGCQQLKHD
jgi:formamidopyrimidine-DNA glycosylase